MSDFEQTAEHLVAIAKALYARGWLLGTSGNLSAVLQRDPLRLAITPSGADKGELQPGQILKIDEDSRKVEDGQDQLTRPSDESPLHVIVATARNSGAVIHTHSVWSTLLSDLYFDEGGIAIEGYEMLKGLRGVKTHKHREWIPIIDNSQDMTALADSVSTLLAKNPQAHGFLLRRHGLYTWGSDLKEAKRHSEILEFLLEAMARMRAIGVF